MGQEPLSLRLCFDVSLPFHGDAFAAWQAGAATVLAGANMFKFAPLLGLLLADAAMTGEVPEALRPPVGVAR
jgi:hypothetical protein